MLLDFIYESIFFINLWKYFRYIFLLEYNPFLHKVQVSTTLLNKPLDSNKNKGNTDYLITIIDHYMGLNSVVDLYGSSFG